MLLILISITSFAFGIAAIIFSLREEKAVKKLAQSEIQHKQRLLETTILNQIQEEIGNSLNIDEVLEIILASIENNLTYSTISTINLQHQKLVLKIRTKESISHAFLESVRTSMMKSLDALHVPIPSEKNEASISGFPLDESNSGKLASYFHVPLMINEDVIALITVASTKPNFYKEEDMMILYKIADLASHTLSRLENILSVEKGKLMGMIGSLTDGLLMFDTKGQIAVINNAAKKFLAIEKENPNSMDVLSTLPNTYDFSEKLQKVISQKRAIEEKELRVGERVFHIFMTPVFDVSVLSEKKAIGVSIVMHDITLEHSLAKMKEDFTSIMVHELRSPLTAIKASTELLMSPMAHLSEDEKLKIIHLISDQSRKMLNEVSLILDAAKLEAGLFTISKHTGDLKKIITDKASAFTPQAHEKFVNLVVDIDPTIPNFSFDPVHIEQVVNNLISNSLKFTPSGGTVRISAKPTIGSVVVSVSDTGVGIPKEKQHLLFSKFTQVSSPTATVGTGLGLYIVKGVVEAHGGTVKLDSEEEKGTTITFTLPMDMTSQTSQEQGTPLLHAHTKSIN